MRFAHLEDAKAAQNLNGPLDIGGRLIKVTIVTFISLAIFYSYVRVYIYLYIHVYI